MLDFHSQRPQALFQNLNQHLVFRLGKFEGNGASLTFCGNENSPIAKLSGRRISNAMTCVTEQDVEFRHLR